MRNKLADCIYSKASVDSELFLVVGDAGFGVFDNFKTDFKEQFLNTGINEGASISFCAGLALDGRKVIYYNIAPFTIMRPYEQVRNDVCYQELPIILVGIGSGITYAPSGMTHYAIEDISVALTMPNLDIFSPIDPIETALCFEYAYASNKPSYIRIPKAGNINIHKNNKFDITIPRYIKSNKSQKLLIIHGSIAEEVIPYIDLIDADIISWCYINNDYLDYNFLSNYERIYVAEEHFSYGGLATFIESKIQSKVKHIAIHNHYLHKVLNQKLYRKELGIDGGSILEVVNHD